MSGNTTKQEAITAGRQKADAARHVTIKVRHDTKRLLDLISAAEEVTIADLIHTCAAERWQNVKDTGLLP